ncbi:uncharacterized protein LOC143186681 [Calliopsis andreniformis]|uniref:uncharacterized protein LOC143186681 n=1 Tax=Calliopsis andreniformis TaxID=337506 RepID=UPI003FCDC75A
MAEQTTEQTKEIVQESIDQATKPKRKRPRRGRKKEYQKQMRQIVKEIMEEIFLEGNQFPPIEVSFLAALYKPVTSATDFTTKSTNNYDPSMNTVHATAVPNHAAVSENKQTKIM